MAQTVATERIGILTAQSHMTSVSGRVLDAPYPAICASSDPSAYVLIGASPRCGECCRSGCVLCAVGDARGELTRPLCRSCTAGSRWTSCQGVAAGHDLEATPSGLEVESEYFAIGLD
jgi:hypothetical protein